MVENNTVSQSSNGALFYPLFGYTLIRNNNFTGDKTEIADFSFTTCQAKNGAVAATAVPDTGR